MPSSGKPSTENVYLRQFRRVERWDLLDFLHQSSIIPFETSLRLHNEISSIGKAAASGRSKCKAVNTLILANSLIESKTRQCAHLPSPPFLLLAGRRTFPPWSQNNPMSPWDSRTLKILGTFLPGTLLLLEAYGFLEFDTNRITILLT
jgi:hypothetical protein